jgi:hypothetical protein
MPFVGWDAISRRSAGGGCGAWFDGGIYALKGGSTGELWRYDATADTWAEFNQLPSLGSYGRARKVSVGGSMVIVEGRLFVLKGNKTCEFWRDSLPSLEAPQIAREGAMAAQTRLGDWQMTIGPNPLAGDFAVVRCNLPKGGSATLDIFDASGRRAYPSLGIRNSEARLDLRSMPAGVYLVKATTDRFSTTHKLVVER